MIHWHCWPGSGWSWGSSRWWRREQGWGCLRQSFWPWKTLVDDHWALQLTFPDVLQHTKCCLHAQQCALTCGFQHQQLGIMTFASFSSAAPLSSERQPFNGLRQGSVLVFNFAQHVMDRAKRIKSREWESLELFAGFPIWDMASSSRRSQGSIPSTFLASCTAPGYLVNLNEWLHVNIFIFVCSHQIVSMCTGSQAVNPDLSFLCVTCSELEHLQEEKTINYIVNRPTRPEPTSPLAKLTEKVWPSSSLGTTTAPASCWLLLHRPFLRLRQGYTYR